MEEEPQEARECREEQRHEDANRKRKQEMERKENKRSVEEILTLDREEARQLHEMMVMILPNTEEVKNPSGETLAEAFEKH